MTDRRGQARGYFNRRWDLVQVYLATKKQNQALQGKSVEHIAKEQGKSTIDAFLDLSVDEELHTLFQIVERGTDPKAQQEILGSNYTVIGTAMAARVRMRMTAMTTAPLCWVTGCAKSR